MSFRDPNKINWFDRFILLVSFVIIIYAIFFAEAREHHGKILARPSIEHKTGWPSSWLSQRP